MTLEVAWIESTSEKKKPKLRRGDVVGFVYRDDVTCAVVRSAGVLEVVPVGILKVIGSRGS